MQDTVSAAKGVFVFKNGIKAVSKTKRRKAFQKIERDNGNIFFDKLWYQSYNILWNKIYKNVQILNDELFSRVLSNLVSYVKTAYKLPVSEIPTAALLTGINMPDHEAQFTTLAKEVKQQVSPHVVILQSQDCQTLKYLVETMVSQFVYGKEFICDDEDECTSKLKKNQLNLTLLQSWYEEKYRTNFKSTKIPLVVIIADFEGFNDHVLQNFISIISSYINVLPFILVLGLATSLSILHKSLPYHVSSKVNIQVFNSQPSLTYLDSVIDGVLFSNDCPFNLGGKVFNIFTDIFLYYDFSVSGFIQNCKFAMLEHFSTGNAKALCIKRSKISTVLDAFTNEDFENVRHLYSFRQLVENESHKKQIKLLTDDEYFRSILEEQLKKIFSYLETFYLFLKCLLILVEDLPKTPLGKQMRELYSIAATKNITKTQSYSDCFKLLNFQSMDELSAKATKMMSLLKESIANKITDKTAMEEHLQEIERLLDELRNVTTNDSSSNEDEGDPMVEENSEIFLEGKMDRQQLRQKLLQMSKESSNKPMNKYERTRSKLLAYLSSTLGVYLTEPTALHFHEIFFYNDTSIQSHVVGSHRAAIHTALNNPHSYLQCSCCDIPNDTAILPSMPDISVAYKLHLEYGKMINLYDWMQTFQCFLKPKESNDNEEDEEEKQAMDPLLQARFTQCVAELEFLGFIKSSKRKTDHVTRLTWGG